ncbi:unnamed protein product [Toxocara canis]|uniref:Gelsolin n=1 Tax=Toxocara canis TaxID=6265 RepID=A0A183UG17_TOXCA|nr:unnamed protein product [Toxocara canis]
MGITDPALRGIGKEPGIEIWRIKDFGLEKLPREQYGNFFTGDSYIVLSVQDHESSLFLSYFKDGVKYLQGGAASGFHHINENKFDDWTPRLYHCKGKRNVRCTEVACDRKSLNLGDVFILDCGNDLYVWIPPDSGRLERIKGMHQAQNIRDQERGGTPTVHCLDEDWDSNEEFWSNMGGNDDLGSLKSPEEGGEDENFWRTNKRPLILVKISDASGEVEATMVSEGSFESSQLNSEDAYILNTGAGTMFVWVGKQCTMDERRKAMQWAKEYAEKEGLPDWTQVVRVFEGNEPSSFLQWASAWEREDAPRTPKIRAKLIQYSDRSGRFVGEEVVNFTQEDLDGDDIMLLDTGDNIYVWVGAQANENEKENAKQTAEVYLETNNVPRKNDPSIEVIDQGAEPPEFKQYFGSWDNKLFKSESVKSACRFNVTGTF